MRGPLIAVVVRFVSRLRFPYLVLLTGTLFVADLLVPDLIPFVDELLLGLATVLLGALKKPRQIDPAR